MGRPHPYKQYLRGQRLLQERQCCIRKKALHPGATGQGTK